MNRPLVLLLIFWSLSLTLLSQEGDFFVSQFTPSFNQEDQIYFDILFTDQDELIAANRSGIVRFDGTQWNLIPTPSAPLSVALDADMNIYVACANDFGKISILNGGFQFESLAPLPTDQLLTQQVVLFENKAYFMQDFRIFEFDLASETMTQHMADSLSGGFVYLFPFEGVLWAETVSNSYFLRDSLQQGNRILPDDGIVISTATHPQNQRMILSSHDGRIFKYTDRFEPINALEGKVINDLAWVSENLFAVSTLSEGVFFYDTDINEIVATTDSRNGLPDNEIFAIATDQSSGVWVANTFGFSRIAPLLPIRSFNHYPGLDGNLTTAVYKDETWYLATSDGVYFFDEVNNYRNKVYYVPKVNNTPTKTTIPKTTKSASNSSNQLKSNTNNGGTLRARIGNIFNNQEEDKKTAQLDAKAEEKNKFQQLKSNVTRVFQQSTSKAGDLISRIKLPIGGNDKVQYERRVKKELISTQYLYKQIPDITEKIKQLIAFEDAIIAVTPSGILELRNQVAEEIFSEPVRYVFHPKGDYALWISTQSSGVYKLEEIDNVWVERQAINNLGDVILSIYSESSDKVWMAGTRHLYQLSVTDTSSQVIDRYELDNQFFDNIKITRLNDQLTLVNNQGVFYLDSAQDELRINQGIMDQIGQVKRHLIQPNGKVWIHNGENWMRLDENEQVTQFTYLKLFPEMTYIDQLGEEIWLINDHNSLYKFKPNNTDSIPSSAMFIRQISDGGGLLNATAQKLKISYEKNSVFVDLARPDYMGLNNVRYAYRMAGLNEAWSDWTSSHQLTFNYLPPGDYSLEVKSVDVFGREQYLDPIAIKITPPYWQTTWFSALQVLFFTGLVLIASRLNRSNTESKKLVILSNLLTIVTIVMVIELLQNIAESYFGDLGSPVLAFGLDVFVALLIFPVEMLLRRIVTGNRQS